MGLRQRLLQRQQNSNNTAEALGKLVTSIGTYAEGQKKQDYADQFASLINSDNPEDLNRLAKMGLEQGDTYGAHLLLAKRLGQDKNQATTDQQSQELFPEEVINSLTIPDEQKDILKNLKSPKLQKAYLAQLNTQTEQGIKKQKQAQQVGQFGQKFITTSAQQVNKELDKTETDFDKENARLKTALANVKEKATPGAMQELAVGLNLASGLKRLNQTELDTFKFHTLPNKLPELQAYLSGNPQNLTTPEQTQELTRLAEHMLSGAENTKKSLLQSQFQNQISANPHLLNVNGQPHQVVNNWAKKLGGDVSNGKITFSQEKQSMPTGGDKGLKLDTTGLYSAANGIKDQKVKQIFVNKLQDAINSGSLTPDMAKQFMINAQRYSQ